MEPSPFHTVGVFIGSRGFDENDAPVRSIIWSELFLWFNCHGRLKWVFRNRFRNVLFDIGDMWFLRGNRGRTVDVD